MNWQSINFDWNQMRAFLATVEEGSLSAAARALNLTQPTLGRQVAALETQLGLTLFQRTGRSVTLTSAGHHLLDHVRAMGEAAARISLAATGQSQIIEGKISITASDILTAYLLPPALQKLRALAPRLNIEIIADNSIRDLLRREADIAIRHVRPEQPDLISKLVHQATAHLYAATNYIDQRGRPRTPEDLNAHDFISFGNDDEIIATLTPFGAKLTHKNIHVGSRSGVAAWEMAKSGLGIVIMADDVAENTPGMVRVLPQMDALTYPIWLVTHQELHTSARIRLVFDLLVDFFTSAHQHHIH